MLDQPTVDHWFADFIERLQQRFGERLVFVGQHGSWARGEGRPESDIDAFVVLDRMNDETLTAYSEIVHGTPHAALVSTFVGSVEELRAWPRSDLIQVFCACTPLYGSLEGVVAPPRREDFVEHARLTAAQVMFELRHYLCHPHDPAQYVHRLYYRFKWSCYALQSWVFARDGRFLWRYADLAPVLADPDDLEVVRIAREWHDLEADRTARPLYYLHLLERWSRGMLARVAEL